MNCRLIPLTPEFASCIRYNQQSSKLTNISAEFRTLTYVGPLSYYVNVIRLMGLRGRNGR